MQHYNKTFLYFVNRQTIYSISKNRIQNGKSSHSSNKKIQLKIGQPELKSELGGASKFQIYPIIGIDSQGQFNTVRRYSDFDTLRNTLVAKWPGCFIPCLPEKKIIGNNQSLFLDIRRQGLQYFLYRLGDMKYLWQSQETQLFIRSNGDCQKAIIKLKDPSIENILQRLQLTFKQINEKQSGKQIKNKIIEFGQYLKQSGGLLENLQKMVEQIYSARKKYNQKSSDVVSVLLPDYEINCIKTYSTDINKLILKGQNQAQLKEHLQEFKHSKSLNSVIYVLAQIKREKAQILAFQEILKTNEIYSTLKQKSISRVKDLQIQANKINSGKESILAKIKQKTKQEQLKENQISIQKAQNEEKNLSLLCDIIASILGHSQIDKFKQLREKAYYSLLKKYFELQKEQSQARRRFWTQIGKNQKLNIKYQDASKENIGQSSSSKKKKKKPLQQKNIHKETLIQEISLSSHIQEGDENHKIEMEQDGQKPEQQEKSQTKEQSTESPLQARNNE